MFTLNLSSLIDEDADWFDAGSPGSSSTKIHNDLYNIGNVWIGTNNPNRKLMVEGDGAFTGLLLVYAAGNIGMGSFTNGPTPAP